MAMSQVRAKIAGQWYTLTYNEATGRYEAQFTAPGTSFHQPGGYYNVEAEASLDTGETAEITGTQLPSLRLVVRETAAPTLTLVSPSPGFLTTQTPTFVFDAVDEEGGSGVNPETFSLDGATSEEITGGYRFTWTPPAPWADGSHTVTASVSDYDGNEATVTGSYIVDTVPPELYILKPYHRHVVDDETVTLTISARDTLSGLSSIGAHGPQGGEEHIPGPLIYQTSMTVDIQIALSIGENHITVTAADKAGNTVTKDVYMIRLVTDRTAQDVEHLRYLYTTYDKFDDWPEEEQEWFWQTPCMRGAYTQEDWNRVGVAVQWLAGELQRRGYLANVQPNPHWPEEAEGVKRSDGETYRKNVETIRDAQNLWWLDMLQIPYTMRKTGYQDWNDLEKALVETDAVLPRYTSWTSGEISAGEG